MAINITDFGALESAATKISGASQDLGEHINNFNTAAEVNGWTGKDAEKYKEVVSEIQNICTEIQSNLAQDAAYVTALNKDSQAAQEAIAGIWG